MSFTISLLCSQARRHHYTNYKPGGGAFRWGELAGTVKPKAISPVGNLLSSPRYRWRYLCLSRILTPQSDFPFFSIQPWSHEVFCLGQYHLLPWKPLRYHKFILPHEIEGEKAITQTFCRSIMPFAQPSLPSKYHRSANGEKRNGKLLCLGLKLLNYRLCQECPESSHSHLEQPLGSQLWLSVTLFLNEDEELAPSLRLRLVSCSSLQEYLVEPGLIKTCKQKALGNCAGWKYLLVGKRRLW